MPQIADYVVLRDSKYIEGSPGCWNCGVNRQEESLARRFHLGFQLALRDAGDGR